MPRLRAPGVYFEPGDPPPRRVGEVRTDVAGFVGVAARGPLHVPVKLESWTQFTTRFGGHTPDGFLAYAVKGFFANGGRTCWVVRVGAASEVAERASLRLLNRHGRPVFRVTARDHGPGAEGLTVRVEAAAGGRFSLFVEEDVGHGEREVLEVWRDLDAVPGPASRRSTRYAVDVVNGVWLEGADPGQPDEGDRTELGSVLIEIKDLHKEGEAPEKLPVSVEPPRRDRRELVWQSAFGSTVRVTRPDRAEGQALRAGFLGSETRATPVLAGLSLDHFTGENQPPDRFWGLKALERVDDVAIVAVPDLLWPGHLPPRAPAPAKPRCGVLPAGGPGPERHEPQADTRNGLSLGEQKEGQRALLRHCAVMHDRFAVLDAPAGLTPKQVVEWVKGSDRLQSEPGQFGALYYPWVLVPDPLEGPDVRAVPPAGHVAGMFARTDLAAGVQKPPANEALDEVRGVEYELDAIEHGWLNDEAVNAIRPYPGRGVRVAGARTLVPPTDADLRQWRYVHVRRLLLMFEEAIDQSTQWIVFADNRPERWREIDRVVRTFLDEQWRRGRLDGETADDAYQVACDDSTNPPVSVDAGQMVCVIAVRPPPPAELVIVRLGRRVGETGAVAFGGDGGG